MQILALHMRCGKNIMIEEPTVREYFKIFRPVDLGEQVTGLTDLVARSAGEPAKIALEQQDIVRLAEKLGAWARKKRKEPYYKPPAIKQEKKETYYIADTQELKIVADYTNSSFGDLESLGILRFWRYYRDAVIWNCSGSEAGREKLKEAWLSVQTKPDRAAINELIKECEENG